MAKERTQHQDKEGEEEGGVWRWGGREEGGGGRGRGGTARCTGTAHRRAEKGRKRIAHTTLTAHMQQPTHMVHTTHKTLGNRTYQHSTHAKPQDTSAQGALPVAAISRPAPDHEISIPSVCIGSHWARLKRWLGEGRAGEGRGGGGSRGSRGGKRGQGGQG